MSRLAQLLSIKPGEGRLTALMVGVTLFSAMGSALGGTGIEALFFARFGVEYLPYMYIGLGITAMITSFFVTAALGKIPKRLVYPAIPILIAAVLIVARLAIASGKPWLYPGLWLGKEVMNALVSLMMWGVAGLVCDTRQAKRLFPLFNASFILGQVVGGFATGLIVDFTGAENLLILWAALLFLGFLFCRALLAGRQFDAAAQRRSKRKQPTMIQEMQRGFQYVRASPFLTTISLSTILFSVLFFSIALPFSRAVAERFTDENAIASFLGVFNGLTTAGAFLTSLFIANRIFARIGIMASILLFQSVYLAGFAALIVAPFFSIVVIFRFAQMLLLSGIADPAWQTMFNVVPHEKRDQVRAFVGGVPEQAGVFIAGGILVIGEQALDPQQLYIVGFGAAALCTGLILRAWRGYNLSLMDALRSGRPQIFYSEEQPFGGFRRDAAAIRAALENLRDPDPIVRRVSTEIVGHLSLADAIPALVSGLSDADTLVRLASLKALSNSGATHALLDIAASLSDPETEVRAQAVATLKTLSPKSPALTKLLIPLLKDGNAKVSSTAALAILQSSNSHFNEAKQHLRDVAVWGDTESRIHAISALGEWGDREAYQFLVNELQDRGIETAVRNVILASLAKINAHEAIPILIESLREVSTRETSAQLLGETGAPVADSVIALLDDESFVDGALLTLERLPPPPPKPILEFARMAVRRAGEYDALRRRINPQSGNEAVSLLAESLRDNSHRLGIRALRAVGLLGERDAIALAVEALQFRDETQRGNVIEALESISSKYRGTIKPLTNLWEDGNAQCGAQETDWERLLNDPDEWIRNCAEYAAHSLGVKPMENLEMLSQMDRIIFFKRVPLFANLSPIDLKQVAAIADEETFSDGEEIAREGEAGDVMFVIVSGEVKVCSRRDGIEVEIARRKAGDYVGEMSIIGREPRMASLIAVGDVRTLCIDQKSFEGLIRERPDVSLAVMRVLGKRLKEASLRK